MVWVSCAMAFFWRFGKPASGLGIQYNSPPRREKILYRNPCGRHIRMDRGAPAPSENKQDLAFQVHSNQDKISAE